MLKELVKYIVELSEKANATEVIDIKDEIYIDGERMLPDYCQEKNLNTLSATVDFITSTISADNGAFTYPLLVSATHSEVRVYSSLDKYMNRAELLRVTPIIPSINFNQFLDLESFIIQLQTCFVGTANKEKLLSLVSSFVQSEKLEVVDDGISQKVTMEKGATIKEQTNVSLDPFVKLQAFRTYNEVDQVETIYLLRVKDNNRIALFEADGGSWKIEAQFNVANYLRKNLEKLIEENKVVVIG